MIECALVYIRKNDEARELIGCGTLVEGPYVATCRHVWREADGDRNGGVVIEFYRSKNDSSQAHQELVSLLDDCDGTSASRPDLVILNAGKIPPPHSVFPVTPTRKSSSETATSMLSFPMCLTTVCRDLKAARIGRSKARSGCTFPEMAHGPSQERIPRPIGRAKAPAGRRSCWQNADHRRHPVPF